MLRQEVIKRSKVLSTRDLFLDLDKHVCICNNKEISLTVKEFQILAFFYLKN
ncbi:MAG: hypothetical protein L6U99_07765 [Clostridium sp.]|nr:MAG: hypothetical protein L6U99_07765 [Clostridium sp.]